MKNTALLLAFLLMIFTSCKESKKEKLDQKGLKENVYQNMPEKEIMITVPSPNEVIEEIFYGKLNVNKDFTNAYENAENYLTSDKQALNLGVYIADFAYLSLGSNQHVDIEYLKAIKFLSEKINLQEFGSAKILERLQNNLLLQDSLNKISQEVYYNISEQLEQSNQKNTLILVSSGAFIESLYLSVCLIQDEQKFEEVIKRIYEQKFILDVFYTYAANYKDDPILKHIIDVLKELSEMFNALETKTEKTFVEKTENNKLIVKGGKEFIVSKNDFKVFKSKIIEIRSEIVDF